MPYEAIRQAESSACGFFVPACLRMAFEPACLAIKEIDGNKEISNKAFLMRKNAS